MPRLTPREITIVRGVMEGKQNKAMAFELGLAENTVKVHVSRIMTKTGSPNRTGLAMWGKERLPGGLVVISDFEALRNLAQHARLTGDEVRQVLAILLAK